MMELNMEMDVTSQYDIDKEELVYQAQLRKQQGMFMKQIKQDIVKKIPELILAKEIKFYR